MKLYTEKDVREAILIAVDIIASEKTWTLDDVVGKIAPTELPSNDELFQQAIKEMKEWYGSDCKEEIDAYFRGTIWMKQQIQGGNK